RGAVSIVFAAAVLAAAVATGSMAATAEIYDPTAGTFSPAGSMTTARENHTATLLADGRVLIAGGRPWVTTYAAPRSAELYDPTTGTFTSTGKWVLPREGQTATLLLDGTVLMVGGVATTSRTTTTARSEPNTRPRG